MIATNWSGNVDFVPGAGPGRLVEVDRFDSDNAARGGGGEKWEGQALWAEPSMVREGEGGREGGREGGGASEMAAVVSSRSIQSL